MPVRSHQWSDIQRTYGAWFVHPWFQRITAIVKETNNQQSYLSDELLNDLSAKEAEPEKSVNLDSDDFQFKNSIRFLNQTLNRQIAAQTALQKGTFKILGI